MRRNKQLKSLLFFGIILILVLMTLYSGLRILESTVFFGKQESGGPTKTVTRNGIDYFPRQDITTVLLMTVDQTGATDMNILMVFDEAKKSCSILLLNRDTPVKMPVLDDAGRKTGEHMAPLALAHTYGTGGEARCENTRKAISDYLYGLEIDHYLAMDMEGIALLNDAVGGVFVTVAEEIPDVPLGTARLTGEQAFRFLSAEGPRLERQMVYWKGFVEALRDTISRDAAALLGHYGELKSYIVTDWSVVSAAGMLVRFGDYEIREPLTPAGEYVMGEECTEFHADEEMLDKLILELFYAPKK